MIYWPPLSHSLAEQYAACRYESDSERLFATLNVNLHLCPVSRSEQKHSKLNGLASQAELRNFCSPRLGKSLHRAIRWNASIAKRHGNRVCVIRESGRRRFLLFFSRQCVRDRIRRLQTHAGLSANVTLDHSAPKTSEVDLKNQLCEKQHRKSYATIPLLLSSSRWLCHYYRQDYVFLIICGITRGNHCTLGGPNYYSQISEDYS